MEPTGKTRTNAMVSPKKIMKGRGILITGISWQGSIIDHLKHSSIMFDSYINKIDDVSNSFY
jgi:hypothetical protein